MSGHFSSAGLAKIKQISNFCDLLSEKRNIHAKLISMQIAITSQEKNLAIYIYE